MFTKRQGNSWTYGGFLGVNGKCWTYAFVSGLYYRRRIQASVRKALANQLLIMLGLFLPGIVNDTFLDNLSDVKVYPLLYSAFSVIFTLHLLKHYLHPADTQAIAKTPAEEFFRRYAVSSREQEVLLLLVQGLSNQKIGETLFISPNTVKTHIRNIYAKLEVSSRYELLALVQNVTLPLPPKNS
jgi:DNA-binding CsgD family transcriptional regulator